MGSVLFYILYIGYGISGDFRVIAHSWPFVAEIVGTPCQVIDLQIFARSVSILNLLFHVYVFLGESCY